MFGKILARRLARLVNDELDTVNGGSWYYGDYVSCSQDSREITVQLHGESQDAAFCFRHTGNGGECHFQTYTVRFGSRRALLEAARSLRQGKLEEFLRRYGVVPVRVTD